MNPDLVRVELPVRWEDGPPATHPGRALNAWFYGRLAQADPRTASEIHAMAGDRPFAISIAGAGDSLCLVVSAFGPLAPLLPDIVGGQERLLLDGRWLLVEGEPRQQSDTWGALASRWLVGAARPVAVRLEFLSPTAFHSRGRTVPLPLPELVFGSVLQRWCQWSSVDLGEGVSGVIVDHVAVRRHRIWTQAVKMVVTQAAFLGSAEFTLVKPPQHYAGLLALLGIFAEYAGVGQKVGMGLGCVRATPLTSRAGG